MSRRILILLLLIFTLTPTVEAQRRRSASPASSSLTYVSWACTIYSWEPARIARSADWVLDHPIYMQFDGGKQVLEDATYFRAQYQPLAEYLLTRGCVAGREFNFLSPSYAMGMSRAMGNLLWFSTELDRVYGEGQW